MAKWSVKLSNTCSLNFFEALLRHVIVKETRTKIEHRHTIGSKPTFVKSSKGSMSQVCTKSLGLGRNLRPVGRVDARERKREKERQSERERDILQHEDRPKSVISEGRGSRDCGWTGNEDVVGVTSTGEREKQTQSKGQRRGMEGEGRRESSHS